MSRAIHNATDGLTTGSQKLSTMVVKSGPSFLTYDSEREEDTVVIATLTSTDDDFHERREYRG